MGDGGKGSKPRPLSVDLEQFRSNWDAIFKKVESEAKDRNGYTEVLCARLIENGVERWRTVSISREPNTITTIEIFD